MTWTLQAARQKRFLRLPNILLAGLAVIVLLSAAVFAAGSRSAPQDDATISDFEARVSKYVELRKKDAGTAPRPTNSPDKIEETKQDVAAKSKSLRPDAKQGDIFTPQIADYFRRQISATLAGPDGHAIRVSLRHAEPVHGLTLQVNQSYPPGIPLQSTPPTLLLNLPRLPKELEYRIVGHNLVLHDITPNIVIDFLTDAIPSAKE